MAQTIVGLGDPKAVKRFSVGLAVDVARRGHWTRKWMGEGDRATKPIWKFNDLEQAKGDQLSFDINMQLNAAPIEGDAEARGKGEKLVFYTALVYIDQMREVVSTGGRMSKIVPLFGNRQVKNEVNCWDARLAA